MNQMWKNKEEQDAYFAYIEDCSRYTYLVQRIDDLQYWKYYSGQPKGNSLTLPVSLGEVDLLRVGKELEAEMIRTERMEKIKVLKTALLQTWEKLSRNIYFTRLPVKINKYHENLFF